MKGVHWDNQTQNLSRGKKKNPAGVGRRGRAHQSKGTCQKKKNPRIQKKKKTTERKNLISKPPSRPPAVWETWGTPHKKPTTHTRTKKQNTRKKQTHPQTSPVQRWKAQQRNAENGKLSEHFLETTRQVQATSWREKTDTKAGAPGESQEAWGVKETGCCTQAGGQYGWTPTGTKRGEKKSESHTGAPEKGQEPWAGKRKKKLEGLAGPKLL